MAYISQSRVYASFLVSPWRWRYLWAIHAIMRMRNRRVRQPDFFWFMIEASYWTKVAAFSAEPSYFPVPKNPRRAALRWVALFGDPADNKQAAQAMNAALLNINKLEEE